jgi:hypothetical protein
MQTMQVSYRIINEVLDRYKDSITDVTQDGYKFFNILTGLSSDNTTLFNRIFTGIYEEEFSLEDYLDFIKYTGLDVTLDSIVSFLSSVEETFIPKVPTIRQKLLSGTFKEYGNLNNYLTQLFEDLNNELFVKKMVKDDISKLVLKPVITYGTSTSSYSTYRKAEEAYRNIVINLNPSREYSIGLLKRVNDYFFYVNDTQFINNDPVLITKGYEKTRFIKEADLDSVVVSIFRNDYKYLTIDEVYSFIDRMVNEYIEYDANLTDDKFDYESSLMPDIRSYANIRIAELLAIDDNDLSFDNIKEIIYYLHLIAPFFNINTDGLLARNTLVNTEFDNLKNDITQVREALLNTNNFK